MESRRWSSIAARCATRLALVDTNTGADQGTTPQIATPGKLHLGRMAIPQIRSDVENARDATGRRRPLPSPALRDGIGTWAGKTMKAPRRHSIALAMAACLAGAMPAEAGTLKCPPDSVKVGNACIDLYEASVWRVPVPTTLNKVLVARIQGGKATAAALAAGGATQLGVEVTDDYAPCASNAQNCADDIYAVSLPGVRPSANITWFQAQAACRNAGKRLPSNAEWQAAVAGTPDPGPDDGTTDCNTNSAFAPVATGSRSGCVSSSGAFDMVGNLYEWVADWVPLSTACPGWGSFSNDNMCLSGAGTTANGPGALLRGGDFGHAMAAGPFTVSASFGPSVFGPSIGFRCAR